MSVTAAKGFRASGVSAGLKATGAADIAVIVNDGPSDAAAAVFTSNRCKANPVLWSEQAIRTGSARAVVANSGGANCYTGPDGFAVTHATAEAVADVLGIGAVDVQVCSTGLIGLLNDRDSVVNGAIAGAKGVTATGGDDAAAAIMTTDSHSKTATVQGAGYTIGGIAKGAGMLAPSLATMLVFITTDADLSAAELDTALRSATRVTFDRLDSDGCQSTNDTVVLMASGAGGVHPEPESFAADLRALCHDLTMQLLADAEGADHEITIEVVGSASEDDALEVGRSVARSNLFKCAVFGRDPNWGRILASVGTTSAAFDPADLDVRLNDVQVCKSSGPGDPAESVDMSEREVRVHIDLKSGPHCATIWTNDLTQAYVHENSAYSS